MEDPTLAVESPFIDLKTLDETLWGPEGSRQHRQLPEAELEFDRWAQARQLGFGEGSCVHSPCRAIGRVNVAEDGTVELERNEPVRIVASPTSTPKPSGGTKRGFRPN